MNRIAKAGEEYFIAPSDAVIVIDNRIYSFKSGETAIVESVHVERIQEILKDDGETAPSDVTPRQKSRKSSEA